MSLSALPSSRAGGPPPIGGNWADSSYGSLSTLGPRTFKKKPVLMLDPEELAKAHLAIAMGGAEIMETAPDPVEAPRPRQPAMLLGLVPVGAEEPDEDLSAYPAGAADAAPAVEDEWDEPAEEEADVQVWTPEDEPEDVFHDYQPRKDTDPLDGTGFAEEAPEADAQPLIISPLIIPVAPAALAAPAPPSIEEQLERMRERLAKRAAAVPAVAPEPPAQPAAAEPRVPTIQRIEIDDWSHGESLKGFIPPQEADLAPAAPEPEPVHMPEPVAVPEPPVPAFGPELVEPEPVEPEPIAPEPIAAVPIAAEPYVEPAHWHDEPADLLHLEADMVTDETALDAWHEHVAPVARRASPTRERFRESLARIDDDPGPSLLARLWTWLRSRF
ncbi:MAG: hypothetical protein ABIT10_06745 [Alteraurantiacibacter sp.]